MLCVARVLDLIANQKSPLVLCLLVLSIFQVLLPLDYLLVEVETPQHLRIKRNNLQWVQVCVNHSLVFWVKVLIESLLLQYFFLSNLRLFFLLSNDWNELFDSRLLRLLLIVLN